jgi:hypothetical protein
VKDWFVQREELLICSTLSKSCTLLVDCKVYCRCKAADDVQAVFKADLHVVFFGFSLHPEHVVDCVRAGELQAIVVLLYFVS